MASDVVGSAAPDLSEVGRVEEVVVVLLYPIQLCEPELRVFQPSGKE